MEPSCIGRNKELRHYLQVLHIFQGGKYAHWNYRSRKRWTRFGWVIV